MPECLRHNTFLEDDIMTTQIFPARSAVANDTTCQGGLRGRSTTGLVIATIATAFIAAFVVMIMNGSARAETIDVYDDHGGANVVYNKRWAALAARGVSVRIVGPCKSACTVLLRHIPRSRICVMPNASFGFHLAKSKRGQDVLDATYKGDIKAWIDSRGGLTTDFKWMRAPDIYRYFKKCK